MSPRAKSALRITKAAPALAACGALLLLAGCGSSAKPGGGSAATSSATATTTAGEANGSTPGTSKSSLKVSTRPRYNAPQQSAPVQSGTVQIAYRNITISPDTLRVKAGSTIEWTNFDPVEHNVTSDGGPQRFASKNFGEGETFQVRLTKPGVIHYLCTIHPTSMNGTIQVVE